MILKDTLKNIIRDQKEGILASELGVQREAISEIDTNMPLAQIISGIRRCGKSTLMRQIMAKKGSFYFFNFEDPRASGFELADFEKLKEAFLEECGRSDCYFFDEIQNVSRWELMVRSLLDEQKKVMITGSNASLLSRELGAKLTGRHLRHELFPFSFTEFLKFMKQKPGINSFDSYFLKGGFPEYLKTGSDSVLQELLRDIVARDIVSRYGLRNQKTIISLAQYLLTNVGKEFSYNKLRKVFSLGSTNTIASFVSYLEDSYILFTVPRFDYSFKKQVISPKKAYFIDNGFLSANTASFSEDRGRMLENLVFISLRRKFPEVFYFKGKGECDFIVKEKARITKAMQVCLFLDESNKGREIAGLLECMREFKLKEGLILTYSQEDEFEAGGKKILVKPVWKWLISG